MSHRTAIIASAYTVTQDSHNNQV